MGKNKPKQKQPANKQNKKAKQIFKAATTSSAGKKSQKKTKEIPKNLKQLDLKTKEKADQQLKNLHLKMVSKKEMKKSIPVGKKKVPAPNTDNVQDEMNKMSV